MWLRLLVTTVTLVGATVAVAKSAGAQDGGTCKGLMAAFEKAGKEASLSWAQEIVAKDTQKALLMALDVHNYMIARQMNLMLMVQHKCAVPSAPVAIHEYSSAAVRCLNAVSAGLHDDAACKREDWERD